MAKMKKKLYRDENPTQKQLEEKIRLSKTFKTISIEM